MQFTGSGSLTLLFDGTVCKMSTGFGRVKIGTAVSGVSKMESAMFIFAFRVDRRSMPKRPLKCG